MTCEEMEFPCCRIEKRRNIYHACFSRKKGKEKGGKRSFYTPATAGGTFRFQSISPSSPYRCFNHSLAFLKCPQSNWEGLMSQLSPRTSPKLVTYESLVRAVWARMNALQHAVLRLVDLCHPLPGRRAPSQEHDAPCPRLRHNVNHLLRELLPAVVGVAVGFVSSDREAGVEHQDPVVGPRCQQAAAVRRRVEGRIVLLQRGVDVLQRRRSRVGGTDGEGEPVGLADVVVRVLAKHHDFDG